MEQEAEWGGTECEGEREEEERCGEACCQPLCHSRATLRQTDRLPGSCGLQCVCTPGWAGPGTHCGPDQDADGWPDLPLDCEDQTCRLDNCVGKPNSGQEDQDQDGLGDDCDDDADGDGILNDDDNCPLHVNIDQRDRDRDGVGDVCDNCLRLRNKLQENLDNDELGDRCDPDIDNDGVKNADDNCPKVSNEDQADLDNDDVGDVCDNCLSDFNPGQEDHNHNLIGDVCDQGVDVDLDGVPDSSDNCPNVENADQTDSDDDGVGDDCDPDADNDGVMNHDDNCPLIPNPDQLDEDKDGVGDICYRNFDGDSLLDEFDTCPSNAKIDRTDFRAIQPIAMGENIWKQPQPRWQFRNQGKEIQQLVNSAPGIAIGSAKLAGLDFEGTFYVGPHSPLDNDYIGIIFSFQVRISDGQTSAGGNLCYHPGQFQFLPGDERQGRHSHPPQLPGSVSPGQLAAEASELQDGSLHRDRPLRRHQAAPLRGRGDPAAVESGEPGGRGLEGRSLLQVQSDPPAQAGSDQAPAVGGREEDRGLREHH